MAHQMGFRILDSIDIRIACKWCNKDITPDLTPDITGYAYHNIFICNIGFRGVALNIFSWEVKHHGQKKQRKKAPQQTSFQFCFFN